MAELAHHQHLASPAPVVVCIAAPYRDEAFADGELLVDLVVDEVDSSIECAIRVCDGFDEVPVVVDVSLGWKRAGAVSVVPVIPIELLGFGRHVV